MARILIVGNSGSGKTTLARRLQQSLDLPHLDLDTLAWLPGSPPLRRALTDSGQQIKRFTRLNRNWVIEGCYADLLELLATEADDLVFLNLPERACIANARSRPFEPHKYSSAASQNRNLAMLLQWIRDYPNRTDTCSLEAHQRLYEAFPGGKHLLTSREAASCWAPG
ncbi:MAG: AAA family ATPase [Gammaproteobacteria bacterium]|jgi:adenylate kinase family enzyme